MTKLTALVGTGLLATSALIFSNETSRTYAQMDPPVVAPAAGSPIMTEFRSGTVQFADTKGEIASKSATVDFQGRHVVSAEVLLKGFDVSFTDAEHPVHREMVKFDNIQIVGETVKFDTHLLIRDDSGNIDDTYKGSVDYVVIARTQ